MIRSIFGLISLILLVSCLDLSMSQKEFAETFAEASVKPVSDTTLVGGRSIHYVHLDQGKKDLLVFVHGSPGSWSAFVEYFKSDELLSQFDIVSVDRPGFGASDYGIPESSLAIQVALIHEALAGLSYNRKFWIGHSLGGPVVARMSMDYPDAVQGMVLLAPSVDPEMEKYEWYRSWLQTKIVGAVIPTDFWVSNEEILPLKQELEKMLPLWESIEVPTLIIHGTKDQFVPVENAYFAKRMMKNSWVELTILQGVNHFIPWSHQDLIIEKIRSLQ